MMLSLFGWCPDYIDPDDFLTLFLKTGANKWTGSQYSNLTVDQLVDQVSIEVDQTKRVQLYAQVRKILAEDVPFISLLQGSLTIVYSKNVGGVMLGPTMLLYYIHYIQKLAQTTFSTLTPFF